MTSDRQRPARSILERIEAAGGRAPRVQLKETESASPVLEAVSLRQTGRYEVEGRIARGGVGIVLKGRDTDLARDVALKVLRERHLENADLVRRFVEEAQIGGQLQHPGILPVFELGLLSGRRPYFAMKLVKGRTLASELADRDGPGQGRRRFLGIFARICATVAYAHSRGVIHRDLKPSNIMVGAYGEVLVVDWGFAKVLSRGGVADERRARKSWNDVTKIATLRTEGEGSASIAGSIMGTPAYMPPEQALGQIADLDERSDVFCLGGILTEILTGEPTYTGDDSEVLVLAARGRTGDAEARLDRCGADAEIVGLAKRSLALLKKDRPRDAAVLAKTVEDHLAAAEERARRSRVDAAEARREAAAGRARAVEESAAAAAAAREEAEQRARAERARKRTEEARIAADEAHRARRQTRILTGSVLLVLLVGLGGYLLVSSGIRGSERRSAEMVGKALAAAYRLQGEGKLTEAVAKARIADRLAGERGVDEETREETGAALAKLEDLHRLSEAERTLDARNRRLLRSLTRIRAEWGRGLLSDHVDAACASALREDGLDVEALSKAEASDRIRARGDAAEDLAALLDEWAWLRRMVGRDWKRIVDVAGAVDADATRNRIRDLLACAEPRILRMLAASLDPAKADPRSLSLMGFALTQAGDPDSAVKLLEEAQFEHPGDVWVNLRLAMAMESLTPPRTRAAGRYYVACFSLLPDVEHLLAEVDRSRAAPPPLPAWRKAIGWRDPARYFTVEINVSAVTEMRTRIYAEKEAVTRALLAWPAGVDHKPWEQPPMDFRPGTVFVAESLDIDGRVTATRTIRIRDGWKPEYLHFDEEGRIAGRIRQISVNESSRSEMLPVPQACAKCHEASRGPKAENYVEPMRAFPVEKGPRRVVLDDRFRDAKVVGHFGECSIRGDGLFGPYAAIWLMMLREGAKNEKLSEKDQGAHAALKAYYPDILGGK